MTRSELKIDITINGQKVLCGHNFLENIAKNIPDIKGNKKVFDVLVTSNNDEVREAVSCNEFLSKEAIEILLQDENMEVIDNILSNRGISKHITDEQLNKIIEKDNTKLLSTIASNIDDFKSCEKCKVIKKLAAHPSSKVRYSLLGWIASDLINEKTLKQLCEDSDIDVATAAKEKIKSRF